ncbi:DNRLRE domain-containing protein [Crateriforma spongiae]|uniref:DNRLRE domain-containing protein n=1 Tax=Crateriforma spongiae TaxID=2724528 RepID=UPI0039B10857
MNGTKLIAASFIWIAMTGVNVWGEVLTLALIEDTYIDGSTILGGNNDNHGNSAEFSASRNTHLWSESLIRPVDIFGSGPSQVGINDVIHRAQLHVWLDLSWGNPTNTFSLYQLESDWSESTVTSNSYGRVAQNATGGPIDSLAGPTTNPYSTDTEYVFDVTISLQDWQSGVSNFGWGLTGTGANNRFFSSESTNMSRRPSLVIDASAVPEPTVSAFLLGLAIVGGVRTHKKRRSVGSSQ